MNMLPVFIIVQIFFVMKTKWTKRVQPATLPTRKTKALDQYYLTKMMICNSFNLFLLDKVKHGHSSL